VRERAVEVLETFESETPITIRMIMSDDRLFAVVRTDDDAEDPVVIWNEADVDGYNHVREVWLPTDVAETVGAFANQKNLEKELEFECVVCGRKFDPPALLTGCCAYRGNLKQNV